MEINKFKTKRKKMIEQLDHEIQGVLVIMETTDILSDDYKALNTRLDNLIRTRDEIKNSKKDLSNVWKGLGIIVSIWGVLYTTRLEIDGSYTTSAGKKFVGKIIDPYHNG